VWRGRPRPRKLTTKPADSSLLSQPTRGNPSRHEPRDFRRIRSHLRKKRRPTHRPRSSNSSLSRTNPGPGPRRHNPAERSVVPASRRSRHSRNPPLPGKRHSHNRPPVAQLRGWSRRSGLREEATDNRRASAPDGTCRPTPTNATLQKQRGIFPDTTYCAGVVGAAAGVLAVTSGVAAGPIFTVARIFPSR
jgi:hypothetical protein